jgi:hypothetical protein
MADVCATIEQADEDVGFDPSPLFIEYARSRAPTASRT